MRGLTTIAVGAFFVLTAIALSVILGTAVGSTNMPFKIGTYVVFNGDSAYYLPQCTISTNPYGGANGTYELLNCLAIQYNGTWVVVRFYYQSGDEGVILSLQNQQYSSSPGAWTPWIYIGTNGYLYFGDATSSAAYQVSFQLNPGWHTLIAGEYFSGGTYYIIAYLDSTGNSKSTSTTYLPSLFGWYGPYPYGDIGTGYAQAWQNTNGAWFFYNGYIQYIVIYAGNTSKIENELTTWLATEGSNPSALPPSNLGVYGPYAEYTVQSFQGSVWYDESGNNNYAMLVSGTTAASEATINATLTLGSLAPPLQTLKPLVTAIFIFGLVIIVVGVVQVIADQLNLKLF